MSTKKTLRKGSILKRSAENRRGVSPVISTIIISSTLLIILAISSFVSANILELQIGSTEFEQAKTNMLLLDEVVQDVALRRGSGGYVQFNQRGGGIGVSESIDKIRIESVPVSGPGQQPIVTLRNATVTSGGWTTPDGAYVDGGAYASVSSGQPSAFQTYSGYGFNIPLTTTVTKVRARVDAWTANPATTLTLRPNAAGTYQEWATFGSGNAHWDRTTDQSNSTGVQITTSTTSRETENIANTSQTGTISSLTVHMRAKATGSNPAEKATLIWKLGGTQVEAGEVTIDRSGFIDYSNTRTTDPSGGPWEWTDVNSLEVGSRATALGTNEVIQVSEYWVVVAYTLPSAQIRLQLSCDGGGNWIPVTPLVQDLTTTETTYWFDVTSLTNWSPYKINSNMIQVKVDAYSQGSISVYLDWIPIEATYVPPGDTLYESPNLVNLVYRSGSHVSGADNTLRGNNSLVVNMTNALSYLRVETGQGLYIKLDYYRVRIIETGTIVVGGKLNNFIEISYLRLERGNMGGSETVNVKIRNMGVNTTTRTYDGGKITVNVQLGLNTMSRTFESSASKTVLIFTEIVVQVSTA